MCKGMCLFNGTCTCGAGPTNESQKCKDEETRQTLKRLPRDLVVGQYASNKTIEEMNRGYCKAKLAVHVSRLHMSIIASTTSVKHDIESGSMGSTTDIAKPETFLNPFCCAGTLVKEARPTHNMVAYGSEMELVHTPDDIDTTVTTCYTDSSSTKLKNEVNCGEESGVNSNNLTSLTRTTPKKNDFNLDEELSKNVIPFASNDDGASRNESTFGVFSSSKRDFNYSNNSYKARIVGKSGSTGAYCEANKPHRSQDHQLTLPHPVDISNDSPVKKLVTG